VALMLRHSLKLEQEALAVEQAVDDVLARGLRTPDLSGGDGSVLSTAEMGEAVADSVRNSAA
jgi:3-isopropylmalate dehydrogenase